MRTRMHEKNSKGRATSCLVQHSRTGRNWHYFPYLPSWYRYH